MLLWIGLGLVATANATQSEEELLSRQGQCYEDHSRSRLLADKKTNANDLTTEKCIKACSGYLYAGTQVGEECFCGNIKPPDARIKPDSECNWKCKGNSNQMCGGGWRINVYNVNKNISPKESATTSPCPSDACWNFDATKNECKLKAGCTTISCGAKAISFQMLGDVFGFENAAKDSSIPMTAQTVKIGEDKVGKSGYGATCNFGECDMTSSVVKVDDKDKLEVKFSVSQSGNSRTRSDVADTEIELESGLTISTKPYGVSIDFICRYPLVVNVTSSAFDVADVAFSGQQIGDGTLDEGFEITVGRADGNAGDIILGQRLIVKTTWTAPLAGVKFFFSDCSVSQGQDTGLKKVQLVKEKCFSNRLNVGDYDTTTTAGEISFQFKSFDIKGSTGNDGKQTMICGLVICKDNCDKTTSNTDCPNKGTDVAYMYTFDGNPRTD